MSILHCVFLNFRPDISAAQKAELYGEIAALQGKLPGLLAVAVGNNVSPEGLDRGFGEGFVVTFADEAARDLYLADPDHRQIGGKIVAATQGGLDGVFVYDLKIEG